MHPERRASFAANSWDLGHARTSKKRRAFSAAKSNPGLAWTPRMWGGVGRRRLFNSVRAKARRALESGVYSEIPGELLQLRQLEIDGFHLTHGSGGDEAKLGTRALLVVTEQARGFLEWLAGDGGGQAQAREQRFRAPRELGWRQAERAADAQRCHEAQAHGFAV